MEFPFIDKRPGPEGTYPRNLYFSPESDTGEPVMKRTPCLTSKADILFAEGRGIIECRGDLYVVIREKVYKVNSAWSSTQIGSLPTSSGPVSMAKSGAYVLICDGANLYYYKRSDETWATTGQKAAFVTYQDGYFLAPYPNSDLFYMCTDPTSWSVLDEGQAGRRADYLRAMLSNEGQVASFGEDTLEWYYDSGNADFPWDRVIGATQEIGIGGAHTARILDKSIFFLDSQGRTCRTSGNDYGVVSTPELERRLKAFAWSSAIASAIYWNGQAWWVLTFPGSDNETWVYDASTGAIFQWSSGVDGRKHKAPFMCRFGSEIACLGYDTGKIYVLDEDAYTDDGDTVKLVRTMPPLYSGGKQIRHNMIELRMKTGVGAVDGSDPLAMLRFSDDHMKTWSNEMVSSLGVIGEGETLAYWDSLGISPHRIYEWSCTEAVPIEIYGAYFHGQVGRT